MPDLPAGWAWPTWRGEPMAFIAQVRLDEVPPHDPEGDLPHTGLLSIFFATDCEPKGSKDDDDPTSWRVLYFDDDPATFIRQEVPTRLAERSRFPASPMTCSRQLTLHSGYGPEFRTLGLSDAERRAYLEIEIGQDVFEERRSYPDRTCLLGHPYGVNDDPLLHAYLASRGLNDDRAVGQEGYGQSFEEVVRADWALDRSSHEEWRLLFQTSGGASDMDWAGGGVLHVTIKREALRRRDFSQVWMDIDFV
jgi:hypothetical protein